MANPEQTTGLGSDDGGLDSVDLELLEGSTGDEDRGCGTKSKTQTFLSRNGKGRASIEKRKPLNLLDLPMDVLKDIIKEVRDVSLSVLHSPALLLTLLPGNPHQ